MKLFAILLCVALLYGVSSETLVVDERATADDTLEEHVLAIESNEFDTDDEDNAAVTTALDEWDEEAALDWADGQTDEDWDEAHTLAWMYGEQAQVTYELDSGLDALTKGRLSCSCSRARRDCSCCFKFRILWKKFKACLVAYYRSGEIGLAAKLNSKTIIRRSWRVTRTEVQTCRRVIGKKVCVGLSDIHLSSNSVSARGKFQVKGIVTKKTRQFSIRF